MATEVAFNTSVRYPTFRKDWLYGSNLGFRRVDSATHEGVATPEPLEVGNGDDQDRLRP